jgi:hypothetical protein
LAIHYMDYLQKNGIAITNADLIDPNVQPSESVFTVISQTPLCGTIVSRFLQKEEVYVNESMNRVISVKNMM